MKQGATAISWPLTAHPGGSLFASETPRPQPMSDGFCVTQKELSRSAPARLCAIPGRLALWILGLRMRSARGENGCDRLCADQNIEQRLTLPRSLKPMGCQIVLMYGSKRSWKARISNRAKSWSKGPIEMSDAPTSSLSTQAKDAYRSCRP